MNRLIRTCKQMWPNNQGCITCKEGYYKSNNGKTCQKCDSSCKTCFNGYECITCVDNYYLIPESNQKLCKHFNESKGCINITQTGCIECEEGMYLSYYECHSCPSECSSCSSSNNCQTCKEEYVLNELGITRE